MADTNDQVEERDGDLTIVAILGDVDEETLADILSAIDAANANRQEDKDA